MCSVFANVLQEVEQGVCTTPIVEALDVKWLIKSRGSHWDFVCLSWAPASVHHAPQLADTPYHPLPP